MMIAARETRSIKKKRKRKIKKYRGERMTNKMDKQTGN